MVVRDDPNLPPRYLVENYRKAYSCANGRDCNVRYMGNHWYNVNGETVHRTTITQEITRLRAMSQRTGVRSKADKGVIQRLISRLRTM